MPTDIAWERAECVVCGDFAVVTVHAQHVCAVCFRVLSALLMKRVAPDGSDARELMGYLFPDRRMPTAEEITKLLELVTAARSRDAASYTKSR